MNADFGRRRPLLLVLVLLVIAIMVDRLLIAGLCPWVSSLGGISLMAVFLDIPVALPMIDPLPVSILFSLFYSMMPVRAVAQGGDQGEGLSSIWGGFIALGCWMAAGALIFYFSQGFLTREVRNGIDSFGIQADIRTPFTEYSTLHLRGGFILLLCFIIGGRTLVKRVNRVSIARPVPDVITAEADTSVPVMEPPVCTMIAVEPPKPVPPRTAMKSVAVVAPRPVEIARERSSAEPTLY